jgi:hypothetical protein
MRLVLRGKIIQSFAVSLIAFCALQLRTQAATVTIYPS